MAAGEVDEGAVVDDVAQVGPAQRGGGVDGGHVDVAVEGGEDEAGVEEDDPGDGAGAAEAVAVLRVEGGQVEAAGDVEEADGAVGETRREVMVGESEAAADEAVVVDELEGCVLVPARPESGGCAVAVDVLLPPRRAEDELANVPDASRQVLPQKIGP